MTPEVWAALADGVCDCLGQLRTAAATAALACLVDRYGADVRMSCVDALRAHGPRGLPHLLRLLAAGARAARGGSSHPADATPRVRIAELLGALDGRDVIAALLAAMDEDPSPAVRQAATASLARHRDPRVVPRLVAVLRRGEVGLRPAALALGESADLRVVPPLIDALDTDCLGAVATALAKLGDERAVAPLLAAWERALAPPAANRDALDYLYALAAFDDPRTRARLTTAVQDRASPPWVRKGAKSALATLGWSRAWRERGVPSY